MAYNMMYNYPSMANMMNYYGGMMYGQYGFGFLLLSWVTSLLFVGVLVAAIYWLIKSANRKK